MEYIIPESIEEIKEKVYDRRAYYIAGGTDIMVLKKNGMLEDWPWVDISCLDDLRGISFDEEYINIGSLTAMSEIAVSEIIKEKAKALIDACSLMGSPLIRNLATIGGNIANSNPAGDTIPPLCALDAILILQKGSVKREVPADEFCLGPGENILSSSEIITKIKIPVIEGSVSCFMKLGQRNALTISKVSVAVRWIMDGGRVEDIHITMGAVGPKCLRAKKAESILKGQALTTENMGKASDVIRHESSPIDDFRSTKEYRKKMTGVLLRKIIAGGR